MFVVLYKWKIRTGDEERFAAAWTEVTQFYLDNFDSLGSRLHKGSDGLWYGYAQWKSEEQRSEAFKTREQLLSAEDIVAARTKMTEAVIESFPEVRFEIASDLIKYPSN